MPARHWRREARQGSTTWRANILGGPSDLTGNFILAERLQVESLDWWEHHGCIAVIIQCAGERSGQPFNYPARDATHMIVDPRDQSQRQTMLDAALLKVKGALRRGQNVLVLCEQSFRRGLVVAAALTKALTGTPAQAFWQTLS